MQELQKDVRRLSGENRKLLEEIQSMRKDLQKQITPQTQPAAKKMPPAEKMTLEKMKAEVAPLLKEIIAKIKESSETPKRGNRYGMRIEYDLPHAFFGLIRTENRETPYMAKVIVRYEKFLESQEVSRSYGLGSTTFLFEYRANRWLLQDYE